MMIEIDIRRKVRRLSGIAVSDDGPAILFMYYVYFIQSIKYPETTYVGYTTNIRQRLETHNSGGLIHTKMYRPWQLKMFLGFQTQQKL